MAVTINGTTGVTVGTGSLTFSDSSTQTTAATGFGFKNRIINGAMMIDQRNAGAAVTVNSGTDYFPVDRFLAVGTSSAGVFTVQRSSTAPTGFINSLLATVTTVDSSLGTTDQYYTSQIIEGLNVSDLAWGTANAATVTLSFWVRSSVVGTFGGSIRNSATDRSYAFTYTISSANTFEYKTVTIAGDQSGTWLTTNGVGMHIIWQFGLGSDRVTSAGTWATGNYKGASGVTNLMATSGATFYITGVQLEKGSTATSFDYRPYGTELALCQRYYEVSYYNANTEIASSYLLTSTFYKHFWYYKVTKRAAPTIALGTGSWQNSTPTAYATTENCLLANNSAYFYALGTNGNLALTASAEL